MNQTAALLMVASGAIHAVVNAVVKAGGDKMSSRALIDGVSAILVMPLAFVVPLPHGAWPWLAASTVVHLFYLYFLIRAFEVADMSTAYPIMRGSAPVIAAIVAVALFDEPISWAVAGGIGLVTLGTLAVALWRAPDARALGWALATGAMVAAYTVIDAQGVRAAPSAASYFVWVFMALGGFIACTFALWRGPVFLSTARQQWKPGLLAGALSIGSYGLALFAYRIGDVPRLAALRETSILFGVLIAVVALNERVGKVRLAGAAAIALGAFVLVAVR